MKLFIVTLLGALTLSAQEQMLDTIIFEPKPSLQVTKRYNANALLWHSDDNKLIADSANNIGIREATSGTYLQTLQGHNLSIRALAWLTNPMRLISAGAEKTIKIWNPTTAACLQTLRGHSNVVRSVCCLPHNDGLIASGSWDNTLKLWDSKKDTCVQTLTGHTTFVMSVDHSSDDKQLVSGSWDKTVKLWDNEQGTCIRTCKDENDIYRVNWIPHQDSTMMFSSHNTIKYWDTREQCSHDGGTQESIINDFHCSPNGLHIAAGLENGNIVLWDFRQSSYMQTLTGCLNGISSIRWSPDGTQLAATDNSKTITIWNKKS